MDIKVSDVYAYVNRREINDFMRDNDTIFAYQIYLRDMNKINDRLAKKKVEEKSARRRSSAFCFHQRSL